MKPRTARQRMKLLTSDLRGAVARAIAYCSSRSRWTDWRVRVGGARLYWSECAVFRLHAISRD
eukprot:3223563-Prymnesium_polylepis.1